MEKKQVKKQVSNKKQVSPKKKAAAPKKKIVKKADLADLPIIAPEATPFVAQYHDVKVEVKVPSLWNKIKGFLGL